MRRMPAPVALSRSLLVLWFAVIASISSAQDFERAAPKAPILNQYQAAPQPTPSDIAVIMWDETGLDGNYNYLIREASAHLIPAFMAVAGKPVVCVEGSSVERVVNEKDGAAMNNKKLALLNDQDWLAIGANLKTATLVVISTREQNGALAGSARAYDVKSGETLGKIDHAVRPSYFGQLRIENLFDAPAEELGDGEGEGEGWIIFADLNGVHGLP